ncbi:sensor histidine kinase [Nannocystis bainbridge]|uniref:histidine kinase n=1 Tax=Nannocystis bainbridge TaxID=2995303 RepID=A0ABT5DRD6_9BACT|nr:HAMP domain-containing sensor histidine kinase [Nannocystis bainbridge]MDC0716212.1 HAMP domain-containing sensor histidine kinase [Nannocystis bainbridge]
MSVVQTVLKAYLVSVIAFAVATVAVGSAAMLVIMVRRDDAHATALARTLGTELRDHEADPRPEKDALIAPELQAEQWFGRRIEAWRGTERIGGPSARGVLAGWVGEQGCRQVELQGTWSRVCAIETDAAITIVVASPLAAILADVVPLIGAMIVTALAVTVALSILGRGWLRRRLSPLAEFERQIGGLQVLDRNQRIESDWGVAEVDTLASTLNSLFERIQRSVEREQRFVADAAHELRTPLTRLCGQLELASEELPVGSELHDRVTAAARTSQELGRTMEILLALARNQAITGEAVDLDEVVTACVASLPPAEAARVHVRRGEPAIVRGDELLLRLALGNLLDNALKYSPGAVEIGTYAGEDEAVVQVDDHGPGLSEADLTRIRTPFVRGSNHARRVRGAGLGLALVEHVAALHRGALGLANTGDGLRATLRFSSWRSSALGDG